LEQRGAEAVGPFELDGVMVGHVAAGVLLGEEATPAPPGRLDRQVAVQPVQDVPDMHGLLDHEIARPVAPAQPAAVAGKRAVAAGPGGAGFDQGTELAPLDSLHAFAEPGIGTPLKPDVNGQFGAPGRLETQSVAACQGQRQWLLGVEMLAGAEGLAADRFVQIAWDGHEDGVDVRALQQSPRVLDRLRTPSLDLLDDALTAHPVLRFRVADPDDMRGRQVEQGTQKSRASVADADHAQPHRFCFGGSQVGFGQRSLREGQAGRGRTAKKPTPVEGDGWHRRKTPRKCTGHKHATQAGKIRLIPLLYLEESPRSTATPAPDSVEPGNGPVQSGCVSNCGPVKNIKHGSRHGGASLTLPIEVYYHHHTSLELDLGKTSSPEPVDKH